MDIQKAIYLLEISMNEMRRTGKLLQLAAVGAKIDLDHYCIKANFEKADEIEEYLKSEKEKLL